MSVYDLAVTDALLSTTRAVRKRLDFSRPVADEIIRQCLELSLQAPSGSNRQGWRWIVVTDGGKRRALADLYRKGASSYLDDGYREAKAAGAAQDVRVFESARYLFDRMEEAPVHVIPGIKVEVDPGENPELWWPSLMGSILPSVWSFQLALRARGLGSTYTTLHLSYADEVAALLGIPEDIKQVGLLPVAYTLGTDFKPATRRALDEVLHWNGW
ncbi:MAG: nitroreductase family protein [Alphaproteobacteria bacterium]|nr:nitroreductase family protein [Alphaproteobacteria bacterium]MDP6590529.1 nitroreductase family protein [Alphaproteobacteria bacterium]MDP6819210.1 nitroreductase family protein [Alphaproteobacteria bacterium]